MNLVLVPYGGISISFGPESIATIKGQMYKNVTYIGRLLSYQEYVRILSFDTSSPVASALIEEDVFEACIHTVTGVNERIVASDIEEAGIVSSIVGGIVAETASYFTNAARKTEIHLSEVREVDMVSAIVSRFMNIPFTDVQNLPINELYKKFAILTRTFSIEINNILGALSDGEQ